MSLSVLLAVMVADTVVVGLLAAVIIDMGIDAKRTDTVLIGAGVGLIALASVGSMIALVI